MTSLLSLVLLMAVAAECPLLTAPDYAERNLYRGYIGYVSFPSFFPHEPCETGEPRVDVFAPPGRGRRIAQLWREKKQGCQATVHAATNDSVSACPRSVLPYGEYGYEEPAFIVLKGKGKWVKIALDHGAGWIEKESGSKNYYYEDLAFSGLSETSENWNGFLFHTPGGRKWKPAWQSVGSPRTMRMATHLWTTPREAAEPTRLTRRQAGQP
jgi:hypothetical protein